MTVRKTFVSLAMVFVLFFSLGVTGAAVQTRAQGQTQEPAPVQQNTPVDDAIRAAFEKTASDNRLQVLGFLVYDAYVDHIQYSADGQTALLWLGLRDPETGDVIATEPGLAVASNPQGVAPDSADSWTITTQADLQPAEMLLSLPPELVTDELRQRYLSADSGQSLVQPAAADVYTGYKLPWTAGLEKRVTNSIGHYLEVSGGLASCPASCRYAFDFADGTMFPLLAAKGGTVKSYKVSCSNGDTNCTNYLILEDQSTIPTTYQVYYHLAHNSVPDRLRVIGTPVRQGEYIGDTDDTGYSTGHHLHYHVYVTPTGANWSWGNSVDITFDDVPQNGGRPRTCAEASQYPALGSQCMPNNRYRSGNTPANPPSASIAAPADRQKIVGRTVLVAGSASDDIQVARIQVMVNYDGAWKAIDDIAPAGNGPFSKEVDLCAAGVPDGPFGLTVRVFDREGSQAPGVPVLQLAKNGSCSGTVQPPAPPACIPSANQVALYSETDFRGTCQRFDLSSSGYTVETLNVIGDNNAASIQVGANVRAVLFDRSTDVPQARVYGRIETFEKNDAGLSDNLVGSDQVSGLWVVTRTNPPDEPFINTPGNQYASGTITTSDSLVLGWTGGERATSFDLTLTGPGVSRTLTVASGVSSYSAGSLPAGSYTFRVVARNSAGTNTSTRSFTVTSASLPGGAARSMPYSESFEAGAGDWTGTGLWRRASVSEGGRGATNAWAFSDGTDYSDATWRAGDLTSPPLTIPSGGPYYLRFAYFTDVEDGRPAFDQRRVQVSENGGPFTDLFQLSDDKQVGQVWLNSGPISLSKYAGKTIRLRFHFDAMDDYYNSFKGWMVDDVSISTSGPNASCTADNNNTPDTAQSVSLASTVTGVICPERDVDYIAFTAQAGQYVIADVNAKTLNPASSLDPHLYLLDSDKVSVIAENDDEEYGVRQDSLIAYTIQRAGTYYLKLKAWDYPGVGSASYNYQLLLNQNASQPPREVTILNPGESRMASANPFDITVQAVDFDGGPVAEVAFYWHSPDWSRPEWVKLGVDTTPGDGWRFQVDPGAYGAVNGAAVYVQARSRTGGVLGDFRWDLMADLSIPNSRLEPLPAQVNTTAFKVAWTAEDAQGDIDRFEIQYQANGAAWAQVNMPASSRSAWFFGAAGVTYGFRIRAVDRAGNAEPFTDAAESVIRVAASCTPDSSEGTGQSADSAVNLTPGAESALYNFCKSGASGADDVDWVTVSANQGQDMSVMLLPKGGGATFTANLYDPQHRLIASFQSPDMERIAQFRWTAPATGSYYIEIRPFRADLYGTDARYVVWSGPANIEFLPLVGRE